MGFLLNIGQLFSQLLEFCQFLPDGDWALALSDEMLSSQDSVASGKIFFAS